MPNRITLEAAQQKLTTLGGQRYATMLSAGGVELEFYAPRGTDPQKPHTRDEMYFILSGNGWFVRGGERWRVVPGEVIHVAAGVPHRFEDFSDDFATWAIFYAAR